MVTESLFLAMSKSGQGTSVRTRVSAYSRAMLEDAARAEPLIDLNRQDERDHGRTLLMKAIKLFGEICTDQRLSAHPINFTAMDEGGVNEHLMRLMTAKADGGIDLNLKSTSGLDSLNFLVHNIVINAQCYFDWWVVTKLLALGADLESRAPSGETPLLHCAGSNSTPNVLQLLLQHGADMDAQMPLRRDNMFHLLIRTGNLRVVDALVKDGSLLRATAPWRVPNADDEAPMEMAERLALAGRESADINRLMKTAHQQWQALVVPFLLSELTDHMRLRDVAGLTLQYLDGSGAPWPKPIEPSPVAIMKAEDVRPLDADLDDSPQPAHGPAPDNPAAGDQLEEEEEEDADDDEEESEGEDMAADELDEVELDQLAGLEGAEASDEEMQAAEAIEVDEEGEEIDESPDVEVVDMPPPAAPAATAVALPAAAAGADLSHPIEIDQPG